MASKIWEFVSELTNTFYWQYKIYCVYTPVKMTNTSELSKCWGEITENKSKILNQILCPPHTPSDTQKNPNRVTREVTTLAKKFFFSPSQKLSWRIDDEAAS